MGDQAMIFLPVDSSFFDEPMTNEVVPTDARENQL